MDILFGSAPGVKTSTSGTTNPLQQGIMTTAADFLRTGAPAPGVSPYGGQFGAPLSTLQSKSLQGMENVANAVPQTPNFDIGEFLKTFTGALNYGGPGQVSAPNVTAGTIDPSQIIQDSVVSPLTKNFNESILPGIIGAYGKGAGGAFSSDAEQAKRQAGSDLERNIASEAGQIGYQAAGANVGNNLAADTTNAANTLTAGNINIGANTSRQAAILQALGLGPTAATTPFAGAGAEENILSSTLAGGAVPQATEQTQLTGQYQDYLSQLQQTLSRLGLAFGTSTSPTVQTNMVANQGSTGLIPSLLTAGVGGFATGAGQAGGMASLLKLLAAA